MPPYLKCSGTAYLASPSHPAARALQIKGTGLSEARKRYALSVPKRVLCATRSHLIDSFEGLSDEIP